MSSQAGCCLPRFDREPLTPLERVARLHARTTGGGSVFGPSAIGDGNAHHLSTIGKNKERKSARNVRPPPVNSGERGTAPPPPLPACRLSLKQNKSKGRSGGKKKRTRVYIYRIKKRNAGVRVCSALTKNGEETRPSSSGPPRGKRRRR